MLVARPLVRSFLYVYHFYSVFVRTVKAVPSYVLLGSFVLDIVMGAVYITVGRLHCIGALRFALYTVRFRV
jgi:hypothetical protein